MTPRISAGPQQTRPFLKQNPPSAPVFVWATGQDDNLGDSLLRRGYLDALRQIGPLSVWVGKASVGFLTALTNPEDRIYSGYSAWYWNALKTSARRATVVALNAGEMAVSGRGAIRLLSLTFLILFTRIRGGSGIWIGAGVPKRRPTLWWFYRMAAEACTTVRWRDASSEKVVGVTGLTPDWAFTLGTHPDQWVRTGSRDRFGIVLRGDRARPSDEWFAWLGEALDALHMKPIVIVQVRRDGPRAMEVASALRPWAEAEVLEWGAQDHAGQEELVRRAYASCGIVIGDRLHGLIVAATEGAVPLGWVESSRGKIAKHFDAVGLEFVGSSEGHGAQALPDLKLQLIDPWRAILAERITEARERLADITQSAVAQAVRRP